ncbi:hypothetical protein JCM10908_003390 [Rhodotorula pacifica]|uniref:ribonuclease Z n=1 Tax=Rhodotorula pacifica TaxID=1495444 RepID=UPI00316CA5C0
MTTLAPAGTRYSVSVLTTHTVDSAPSLLVAFDSQRYLFNTPEAISRIALQNKVGLRKVGHVFLGDVEESAGLPGFILSSVEAGNDRIKVVGPEGTDHFLATCRFFTRRDRLSLQTVVAPSYTERGTNSLPEPIHADQNLVVYAFPLEAASSSTSASAGLGNSDDVPVSIASPKNGEPSSPSRKRRRSSSASPPPRPKSPPGEASFYPSSASFNPARLIGQEASQWRSLVLRDMFRGTHFEPAPPPQPPASPSGRRISSPAYLPQPLPPFERQRGPHALSYLVVGPRLRGKFLPEKARAAGVKPGKAFAKLVSGERVWVRASQPEAPKAQEGAVKGADVKKESKKERKTRERREAEVQAKDEGVDGEGEGRWVEPEECMSAGQDGTAFLVINVPTPAHLANIDTVLSPTLFQAESLGSQAVFRGAFLFLGPGVQSSPLLQTYLTSLRSAIPDIAIHVSSADFIAAGKNEVTFGPSSLLNLRLRQLDQDMFQLPRYAFLGKDDQKLAGSPGVTALSPNTHFSSSLAPLDADKAPFGSGVRNFDFAVPSAEADAESARLKGPEKPAEVQQRAAEAWEAFFTKARAAKAAVAQEEVERNGREISSSVPPTEGALTVTPLGTGSAIPSKYRNVSGTLLHLPKEEQDAPTQYILLDAGEGTWGQIARRFGNGDTAKDEPSKEDVLRGIKMIFLSHMHQDHHAGIATILRKRAQLSPAPHDPLYIVAPPNARTYLSEQHQLFDLGLDWDRSEPGREVRFLDNYLVEPGKTLYPGSRAARSLSDLMATTGLIEVTAVPVLHRCRAWGAVITHNSGWRVVFSGDTMPCDSLVDAGKGASLLVHEATIEDDMPDVARAKGHSTFGQAIDVATRMEARHLLLTHFSARYPKLPPQSTFDSSEQSHRPVVATAFDLMTLRLDQFWKVERYRDAMDALLSWDEADDRDDADELTSKEKRLSANAGETVHEVRPTEAVKEVVGPTVKIQADA